MKFVKFIKGEAVCSRCGTEIKNIYIVNDNGIEICVGSECVEKILGELPKEYKDAAKLVKNTEYNMGILEEMKNITYVIKGLKGDIQSNYYEMLTSSFKYLVSALENGKQRFDSKEVISQLWLKGYLHIEKIAKVFDVKTKKKIVEYLNTRAGENKETALKIYNI